MTERIITRRTFLGGAAALGAAAFLAAIDPRWAMAGLYQGSAARSTDRPV